MSMEENSETNKTLAGLAADSETLMSDAGPGLPDEAPNVSEADDQPDVNVDAGATTGTGEVGNELGGDGAVSVEVGSVENVEGGVKEQERGSLGKEEEHGREDLFKGMNGDENVGEKTGNEMVDGGTENMDGSEKEQERGSRGKEKEQGHEDLCKGMNGDEDVVEKRGNEMVDGGEEDNSREDTGSLERAYAVGDFVWGKIKSHPWWPGRIYDASNASDYALKFSQMGRLLVAYFGDGSFSWCPPSQLVPFVDNFEKMSKQSTSKSFLKAVEGALDEICVLVEFDMTSEESRAGLSWPVAVNAGIKKGVSVPEGESIRLLLAKYETAEILKGLKHHAQTTSNSNRFEFAVLKSWLSAFYRAKCGLPLPLYCEPLPVEGLEDKKDQVIDANDFSIPIEVPIQGPSEEEWPSAKSGPATGDKIYHKRKQKSVAELMGDNAKPKGKKTTVEDSTPSTAETSDKKKRKSGEQAKGHTSKKSGTDLAKRKQLSVSVPERDELGDQLDINAGPLSRERKKSKYLSPPYTTPTSNTGRSTFKRELEMESQKISDMTRIGERMTKAARLILSSPDSNNGKEAVKEKKAEQSDDIDKSSRMRKCNSSKTFDTMDVNSSVNEVLSEVQSTALNPCLSRNGSLEKTRGFISTFRNSVYFDGSNYKSYHKLKTGKKRKSQESENVIAQNGTKSPDSIPSRAKKRKTNHVEPKVTEEAGRETSSLILTVTFATGFSLPLEDEIFQIYNKFGDLNKEETKVLYDSNSVQIVYRHGSNAEEAFKESVKQSPFGAAKVNYRLSYPSSDALRTSEENEESPLSSLKAGKGKSQVKLMKQKLKAMTSILEKCNGRITTEEKSEVEAELKGLLEKVSNVTSTDP